MNKIIRVCVWYLLTTKNKNMTSTEFIKQNYTLTNGGEDYRCNHSGQLVGAEDIAEEYYKAKLKLLGIADVSGSLGFDEGYKKGWTDATSQAINEIQKNYKPNDY